MKEFLNGINWEKDLEDLIAQNCKTNLLSQKI